MTETVSDFALNENVQLKLSGEKGSVIGVATYARRPDLFLVEYVGGDGRQTEDWFDFDALTAV